MIFVTEMAAEVANDLNARLLILTHFSQRYMPVSEEYEVKRIVNQIDKNFDVHAVCSDASL
jgi:ribonuclease BN (tRNA processing enzyme)